MKVTEYGYYGIVEIYVVGLEQCLIDANIVRRRVGPRAGQRSTHTVVRNLGLALRDIVGSSPIS